MRRSPRSPRRFSLLLLAAWLLSTLPGCRQRENKPLEIEPRVKNAAQYLESDPDKALGLLKGAKNKNTPTFLFARGRAHEAKQMLKEAAADYEAALALTPADIGLVRALGRVLPLIERVDDGRKLLAKAVEEGPGDLSSLLIWATLARTPQEAEVAARALERFPAARPKAKQAEPIPAEVHLALASLALSPAARAASLDRADASELSAASAALNLARYALVVGKRGLALDLARKLADSPQAKLSDAELEQVAEIGLQLGAVDLSGRALERVSALHSGVALEVLRGRYLLATGAPTEAARHLKRAWESLRKDGDARAAPVALALARALLQDDRDGDAIELLADAGRRYPERLDVQLLLAHARAVSKDAELRALGMKELTDIVARHPESIEAKVELGRTQLMTSQAEAAIATYEQLVQSKPTNLEWVAQLTRAKNESGHPDAALKTLLERALAAPDVVALRRLLADQYLKMKRPQDAVRAVRETKRTEQNGLDALLLLADVEKSVGRLADVERTLKEAVEQNPAAPRAWVALAVFQLDTKKFAEAEGSLRKAIALSPRDFKQHARLATLLATLGKHAEATKEYELLLAHEPNDAVARNNLAVLYVDHLGDARRGVEHAERAHALLPDSAPIKDTLAWALAKRGGPGDLERAKRLLEEALTTLDAPAMQFHLGYVLVKSGKTDQGRELLQKALRRAPANAEYRAEAQALLAG